MTTRDYASEIEQNGLTDKECVDRHLFPLLLDAWRSIFAVFNGKAGAAVRAIGEILADEQEYHEDSLDRIAIKKLVSTWASRIRGKQRQHLEKMPRLGSVLNPYFVVDEERNLTVADVVTANLWKAVKSEVSTKLNRAGNVRVQTGCKDASDNLLEPIALDLSEVEWSEDLNKKADNVYAMFVPSASDPVETSKEEIAAAWIV